MPAYTPDALDGARPPLNPLPQAGGEENAYTPDSLIASDIHAYLSPASVANLCCASSPAGRSMTANPR